MEPPSWLSSEATEQVKQKRYGYAEGDTGGPERPFSSRVVGDRPAMHDTLGFDEYVDALHRFVTDEGTQPPLVVSVEGAWGAGKSSFMRQLSEKLRAEGRPVVWFNPWRHEEATELWATFVLKLIEDVRPKGTVDRLRGHLYLFFYRLDRGKLLRDVVWKGSLGILLLLALVAVGAGVASVTGVDLSGLDTVTVLQFGVAALGLAGVPAGLKWAWGTVNRTETELRSYLDEPDYEDRTALIERIHEDVVTILDSYVENERVFVFVDDLDRCEVPQAANLIQAIHLLLIGEADVSSDGRLLYDDRLVYFLGIDQEKVAAGIAAKHERLLPFLDDVDGVDFGSTYLDKFIQVPFRVPRPGDDEVARYIASLTADAGGGVTGSGATAGDPSPEGRMFLPGWTPEGLQEVTSIVADTFDHNPRKLKKFVNLFRLRAFLAHRKGLLEDLTLPQLGKTVAITIEWPQLLEDLQLDGTLLRRLHEIALDESAPSTASTRGESGDDDRPRRSRDWTTHEPLLALLRAVPDGDPDTWVFADPTATTDAERRDAYLLWNVDVTELLQVSPTLGSYTMESLVWAARRTLGDIQEAVTEGTVEERGSEFHDRLATLDYRSWNEGHLELTYVLEDATALLGEPGLDPDGLSREIERLVESLDELPNDPSAPRGSESVAWS